MFRRRSDRPTIAFLLVAVIASLLLAAQPTDAGRGYPLNTVSGATR